MREHPEEYPLTPEQWHILWAANQMFVEMYHAGKVPGLKKYLSPEAVRCARRNQHAT